ncbi:porin [Mesosutterella multiformis]|jgi:predicted porin|uniref:porin n=1 Tax=Mesosutterella multiformis TaxID=2259133 RepID=UPI000F60C536|nr:porin [Mesosutterella multiformis]GCB31294.1 porin [Mesosutterella multiformis]
MKKTLLAAALLGSFAASAFAAPSVTLYGIIDTGLNYTHYRADDGKTASTDTFSMASGQSSGSRWGLRGDEKIGSVTVGFNLENGFNSDDGTETMSRLFGREASVHVAGKYGTLYAGREGKLISTAGAAAMGGIFSPFSVLWGDAGIKAQTGTDWGRIDNSLTYVSPSFSGLEIRAQYSFKNDGTKTGDENSSDVDRYAALGVSYKNGPAQFGLIGDYSMWKNVAKATENVDNGFSVIAGGNYDFKAVRVYGQVNYFDNQSTLVNSVGGLDKFTATTSTTDMKGNLGYEGWGISLGATAPAFGGTVIAGVSYRDAEEVQGDNEYKRWEAALGYTYAFSKRTNAYAGVTYAQQKAEMKDKNQTPSAVGVMAGLVHKF